MDQVQLHVAKIRYFEWYGRNVWNFHRRFASKYLAERCRICAISSAHSPLVDGKCEPCRERSNSTVEESGTSADLSLADRLDEVIESCQGKGRRQYDALLLVSGGKDSAILLHRLANDYPELRLLGLTVDTGFLSPVAVENTMALVHRFHFDHVFFRPDQKIFITGFRYALTHLGPKGCYGNVDRFDGDLVHDIARHFAASHKIPILISGVSRKQVQIIFGVNDLEMPRDRELAMRGDTGGIPLKAMYDGLVPDHWWNPSNYDQDDVARVLFPLYAWDMNEDEIRQQVSDLGLIKPGKDSPLVTNNLLLPLMGFVDVAKLGYSSFEEEFSEMIRQGKADYEQWRNIFEMTEYAGKTGWLVKKEVMQMLEKVDLKPADVGLDAMR